MIVYKHLPWQKGVWNDLTSQKSRLHHALLIIGSEGIGKRHLANAFTAYLLCENSAENQACGVCDACRWYSMGNHPDFRMVELEDTATQEESGVSSSKKKSIPTQIGIDQIRALEDFVNIGSHRHGRRVVLIDRVELMTTAAANALLKILEEPTEGLHFILVSNAWRKLLPTLRSRCQKIQLGLPETSIAIQWLKENNVSSPEFALRLSAGTPRRAKEMDEKGGRACIEQLIASLTKQTSSPIDIAAFWDSLLKDKSDFTLSDLVETLQKWLHDLIRNKLGIPPRFMVPYREEIARFAAPCSRERLVKFHRDLLKIKATIGHPLNPQLLLEDMAARYVAAIKPC